MTRCFHLGDPPNPQLVWPLWLLGASAVSSQSCRACRNQDKTSPPDQFITMAVDRPAARPGRGTGFLLSALRFAGYDLDCRPTTPTSPINPTGAGTISAGGRYMHTLPAAAESARTLLEEYSSIRADDVDRHVYQMVRSNPRSSMHTLAIYLGGCLSCITMHFTGPHVTYFGVGETSSQKL